MRPGIEQFLNLRMLVISNALDMLLYMAVVYWLCGDASCVKTWNLFLFSSQLLFNFALCAWLIQQEQRDYRFLWINIFWLAVSFTILSAGILYFL